MLPDKLLFQKGNLTEYFTQLKALLDLPNKKDDLGLKKVKSDTSQQDLKVEAEFDYWRGLHKIGCLQKALDGYQNFINKLKQKEEHSLTEMYFCSQVYYRVSQLHLEVKFIEKAEIYFGLYENLQSNYLVELANEDDSVETSMRIEFIKNQLLKRKAWMYHMSLENEKALKLLFEVYETEK